MKTMQQAVQFYKTQLSLYGDEIFKFKSKQHYGKCELVALIDYIYELNGDLTGQLDKEPSVREYH